MRQALLGGCLLLCGPLIAQAQPFDQAGVRAMGFGGAFVAVADDATATWWNPAALANAPFVNVTLERQERLREPPDPAEQAGLDQTVTGFAFTTPPLGFSYYRTRYTVAAGSDGGSTRESVRAGPVSVRSLVAHQTGITLLHSITAGFVVGSTLKFVRGIAASAVQPGPTGVEEALDTAADLLGKATNRFDADLGAHLVWDRWRAGVTLRNLWEPSFESPSGEELTLQRQARAGLAFVTGPTTLSADLDLTETAGEDGGRRFAVGAEQRVGTRFAVRAGFAMSTAREHAMAALGGSYAIRSGIWLDGFWSLGEFEDSRWGVAGRLTY